MRDSEKNDEREVEQERAHESIRVRERKKGERSRD